MKIMAIGVSIQKEQNKPTFDQILREMKLSAHQCFMKDVLKGRSKKYVVKHKKCRKNLVVPGKRYNFALAFGKQATAAAGAMPVSDNIRQAKSETEKKRQKKFGGLKNRL